MFHQLGVFLIILNNCVRKFPVRKSLRVLLILKLWLRSLVRTRTRLFKGTKGIGTRDLYLMTGN
jgi:hypothetical protein